MTYPPPQPPRQWAPPQPAPRLAPRRRTYVLLAVSLVLGLSSATFAIARLVAGLQGPESLADRIVWSANGDPPADSATRTYAWAAKDVVVSADSESGRVVALDKADGSVRWTFQVPAPARTAAPAGTICTASRDLLSGAVALAYRPSSNDEEDVGYCTGLLLLDLGSGKPRWNLTLPDKEFSQLEAVEVTGGLVAGVVRDYDEQNFDAILAFDGASGSQRWVHETECRNIEEGAFAAGAHRIGFAGTCWKGGVESDVVRSIELSSGRALSEIQVQLPDPHVLSVEPLVVHDTNANRTLVLSEDGSRVTAQFTAKANDNDFPVAPVVGNSVVMLTDSKGWCAWDLRTGKPLWERGGSGAEIDGEEVHTDGRVVAGEDELVMKVNGGSGEGGLLRLDPRTGAATAISPLLDFDPHPDGTWFLEGQRVYAVDNPGQAIAFRIN